MLSCLFLFKVFYVKQRACIIGLDLLLKKEMIIVLLFSFQGNT